MRPLLAILLALLCMLSPLAAWASPVLRASSSQVSAGDVITIEWSQLPPDAHEVELELALDGGRWIRISPELEAHEGRYLWTVPAGLVGDARLRLRYGRNHEEHEAGEIALTIEGSTHVPTPDMTRESGEWWQVGEREAMPVTHALADAPCLAPIAAAWIALPNDPTVAALSLEPATRFIREPAGTRAASPRTSAFAPPRSTPLRN